MTVSAVTSYWRTWLIVFGAIFGLRGEDFITLWWQTGSIGAAWAGWLTRGLPNVPVSLLLVAVMFAIGLALDLHRAREKQARWEERPDGYQPDRRDD